MSADFEPGLVSVVIPAHNRARLIIDTLDSVFAQTHRPIEALVADDGSTDGTPAAIERWHRETKGAPGFRLRLFRLRKGGAQVALNLGLIESRGEFIQFLDSDDVLGRRKIERQAAALQRDNSRVGAVAACGAWRVFEVRGDGRVNRYSERAPHPGTDPLRHWIARGWYLPVQAFLWPRAACAAIGPWDEALRRNQDVDYGVRWCLAGGEYRFVSDSPVYYRQTGAVGKIRKFRNPNNLGSFLRVLEKARDALAEETEHRPDLTQAVADGYYRIARAAALINRRVMAQCLERYRSLSATRLPPAHLKRVHRLLFAVLGVAPTEAILDSLAKRAPGLLPKEDTLDGVFDNVSEMLERE